MKQFEEHVKRNVLGKLIKLIGQERFAEVDFNLVRQHVPSLDPLTCEEVRMAVRHIKESTAVHLYNEPDLDIFNTFFEEEELKAVKKLSKIKLVDRMRSLVRRAGMLRDSEMEDIKQKSVGVSEKEQIELRLLFVDLLRHAYQEGMTKSEIDGREWPVVFGIQTSLAVTEHEVSRGKPIADWAVCQDHNDKSLSFMNLLRRYDWKRTVVYEVHLASAFIHAHKQAEERFRFRFCKPGGISMGEVKVLDESCNQISLAQKTLDDKEPLLRQHIMSYLLSSILLNYEARLVIDDVKKGLFKEVEGEHHLEGIEKKLALVTKWKKSVGNGTHTFKGET